MDLPLVIDCTTCTARATEACSDCVVTFLCDEPADASVFVPAPEARALRLLSEGGVLPALRHQAVAS